MTLVAQIGDSNSDSDKTDWGAKENVVSALSKTPVITVLSRGLHSR